MQFSGGPRISRRGCVPVREGAWTPQVGPFWLKCMQKQKNWVCKGGGGVRPACPPRSANAVQ